MAEQGKSLAIYSCGGSSGLKKVPDSLLAPGVATRRTNHTARDYEVHFFHLQYLNPPTVQWCAAAKTQGVPPIADWTLALLGYAPFPTPHGYRYWPESVETQKSPVVQPRCNQYYLGWIIEEHAALLSDVGTEADRGFYG